MEDTTGCLPACQVDNGRDHLATVLSELAELKTLRCQLSGFFPPGKTDGIAYFGISVCSFFIRLRAKSSLEYPSCVLIAGGAS